MSKGKLPRSNVLKHGIRELVSILSSTILRYGISYKINDPALAFMTLAQASRKEWGERKGRKISSTITTHWVFGLNNVF